MQTISLNGKWLLTQKGKRGHINALVPGCVHTDLLAAKKIENPFFGDNEQNLQWIGTTDWVYKCTFNISDNILVKDRVLLCCHGVDTLATIFLNGKCIGKTDNMFRTWEFDIKPALKKGKNTIEIRFDSTFLLGKKHEMKKHLRVWDVNSTKFYLWISKIRKEIRKEQCNYGWDWGPTLITCGIWRDIEIIAFDGARLTDVHIMQDHSRRGTVVLNVAVTAEVVHNFTLKARVLLVYNNKIEAEETGDFINQKANASFIVENPKLWWPNGMGGQPLYQLRIELQDKDNNVLDTQFRRIGLRTLHLERKKDKWGESFQFSVNGVPFFAKGANWPEYCSLFDKLLPKVIRELDPERTYWPSSPHTPYGERKGSGNPQWGDAHLWSVWAKKEQEPIEWYRTCTHRFVSEFGFQSFPSPKTVRAFTSPEDRNVTSYIMEHHQRHPFGTRANISYMVNWFRMPKDFNMTSWLSQILHGVAMKCGVEHWRRNMPCTMGALYWQFNDCWPVVSWSSVDYYGNRKAVYYMARRFFAPLLISGLENRQKETVEIHITIDLMESCEGTATWTLMNLEGKKQAGDSLKVKIPARKSRHIKTLGLKKSLEINMPRNVMLWLELAVHGQAVSTNAVFFAQPKHMDLYDPEITKSVKKTGNSNFAVSLKAKRPALWVWLELEGIDAKFSDNFFHLIPGKTKQLTVIPSTSIRANQFPKLLRVYNLVDTY